MYLHRLLSMDLNNVVYYNTQTFKTIIYLNIKINNKPIIIIILKSTTTHLIFSYKNFYIKCKTLVEKSYSKLALHNLMKEDTTHNSNSACCSGS